jgi:hypothetical protein
MIDRRGVLGLLGAVLAAPLAPMLEPLDQRVGYVDVDTASARGLDPTAARVFLDGVEVTRSLCVQAADDRRGFIEVFTRDAEGYLFFDRYGVLARERRYGHVRITFE